MICHARPIHEDVLGALKNPFVDELAENIDRRYLFIRRKKSNRSEKNRINVSLNIKFQNPINKTFTCCAMLNCRGRGCFWLLSFYISWDFCTQISLHYNSPHCRIVLEKFIPFNHLIHGFGVSNCACVAMTVLFSDVNKVFHHVGYTCESPFKLSVHSNCWTCVVYIFLTGKLM